MTSITGAGPLKESGAYFEVKHATALKIKEIIDGVISIPRAGYYEFANVYVHDVVHIGKLVEQSRILFGRPSTRINTSLY